MEIVKEFGINPVLLVAQLINFGIILFLLKRFLYKPILTMLKNREEEIRRGVHDAQKARELLEEASEKERKVIRNAQLEAKKLIDEAKRRSDHMVKDAKDETKKEAEQILKEAKSQIAFEAKLAEKRLAGHISHLAVELLEKSLPQLLSEQERTSVMRQAAKKLKGRVD